MSTVERHQDRKATTMGTTAADLTDHTRAERERLADLLDRLEPQQWDTPSLCTGWRIREVAAHLTMPYRTRIRTVLTGVVSHRFSFDRYADTDARATAARMSGKELAELLRANAEHPWSPPGGGPAGALSHDVIHGLDMTVPLGLPSAPTERIAAVLTSTSDRQARHFGVDLRGRRLVATDAEVTIGTGTDTIELPVQDILLTVTGRSRLEDVRR